MIFCKGLLQFRVLYVNRYDLYYYREHAASLTSTQRRCGERHCQDYAGASDGFAGKKLPAQQLALVYRKFAVYHAVQRNNTGKYSLYLEKLWKVSAKQFFITIVYVPCLKQSTLVVLGLAGLMQLLKLLF